MTICASRFALPLAGPLPRGRSLGWRDLQRCARQPGARLSLVLCFEECANVRTFGGVDENLVSGHEICSEAAGAPGGRTASLARSGDKVKARFLRDNARERDLVELAIGRTRLRRDRETRKDNRRRKEGGEELPQGKHGVMLRHHGRLGKAELKLRHVRRNNRLR